MKNKSIMRTNMITIIVVLMFVISIYLFSTGIIFGNTNKDFLQLDYKFNKVTIRTPDNQIIKGNVKKWTTYDKKDIVKVELEDGTVYLGNSSNILLYNEK